MDVPHFLEGLDTSERLREQLTDEQWELHWLCCLETTMLVKLSIGRTCIQREEGREMNVEISDRLEYESEGEKTNE